MNTQEQLSQIRGVLAKYPFLTRILSRLPHETQVGTEEYYRIYQQLIREELSQRIATDAPISNCECFWWRFLIGDARFPGRFDRLLELIRADIEIYGFEAVRNHIKQCGVLPADLTAEELLALLFSPPDLNLPPGHPLLVALGVKDKGEWKKLGAINVLRLSEYAKTGQLDKAARVLATAKENAFKHQGKSDRMEYVSEYAEYEPRLEKEGGHLSANDRLSQFLELAGVEMTALTDVDLSRILDELHALDIGHGFASKRGMSMAAYYGDRADSEKVLRQRLFKKLRNLSSKRQGRIT